MGEAVLGDGEVDAGLAAPVAERDSRSRNFTVKGRLQGCMQSPQSSRQLDVARAGTQRNGGNGGRDRKNVQLIDLMGVKGAVERTGEAVGKPRR